MRAIRGVSQSLKVANTLLYYHHTTYITCTSYVLLLLVENRGIKSDDYSIHSSLSHFSILLPSKKVRYKSSSKKIETMFGHDDEISANSFDSDTITEAPSEIEENTKTELTLGRDETQAVLRLRFLVISALVCATAVVSFLIFLVTKDAETEQFKAAFDGSAAKVVETFQAIIGQKMGAITSLAVSATSYARSQNDPWPFVTMNDFQQRAATARSLSDALFMEVLPLVTDEDRLKWEEYSLENMGWLAEGRAYQNSLGHGYRRLETGDFFEDAEVDFTSGISDKIYSRKCHVLRNVFHGTRRACNSSIAYPFSRSLCRSLQSMRAGNL
jgi:hypothetical protein